MAGRSETRKRLRGVRRRQEREANFVRRVAEVRTHLPNVGISIEFNERRAYRGWSKPLKGLS